MAQVKKEADLGPPVIAWLRERHWDVYQEVVGPVGRADLVATCGPLVAVVELKKSLGLDVLEQGSRWREYAHLVWVAVPLAKCSDAQRFALKVAEWRGFGVLQCSVSDCRAREVQGAPLRRRILDGLRERLRPEQKTMLAAGSKGGGYYTEFRGTCNMLRDYARLHPGATMREAVQNIHHHYASGAGARAHLTALIERGVIEGLRLERAGKEWRVYPTSKEGVG